MTKLKVLDLFSGIGGISLGLERAGGFETVAFCEIEEFQRKVLRSPSTTSASTSWRQKRASQAARRGGL